MKRDDLLDTLFCDIMILCGSMIMLSALLIYQVTTRDCTGYSFIATILALVHVARSIIAVSDTIDKIKDYLPRERRL